MEFIDFFKEREKSLIEAVGEKAWKEDKLYFVDEILEMVAEWERLPPSKKSDMKK